MGLQPEAGCASQEPDVAVREDQKVKTFTVSIDPNLDRILDELRSKLGKTSRADVFRTAINLLDVAEQAKAKGLKLAITDPEDNVRKEIVWF